MSQDPSNEKPVTDLNPKEAPQPGSDTLQSMRDRIEAELLAGLSHELRGPLTAVMGLTELLSAEVYGPVSSQQADALGALAVNGELLLQMVNDLVDLARIRAGRMPVVIEPFHLRPLLDSAVSRIRPQLVNKGLDFQLHAGQDRVVRSDRVICGRVLDAVLQYAVERTPTGASLGLELESSPEGLRVHVWDQGGQDAGFERMCALLHPGEALEVAPGQSTKSELGLVLSAGLSRLAGARLRLEPDGAGARFCLDLP